MTDKIMLQGMTFWGYHGLKAEENTLGQPFVVDVELNLDLRPAGQSDDLAHTVDYGMVTEIAKKVITGKTCCLLETLAETIARTLLIEYPIQRVTVRVRKPQYRYLCSWIMQRWRCAETEMTTAYLGLGSNLGDRRENLQAAVVGLVQAGIRLKKISSLYETQPIGQVEQPLFFNAVLAVETDLSPQQLLQLVLAIENNLGRQRTVRWGPRTIDIDILLYGQKTVRDLDLQIPHPYLSERAFVLVPLLEVAPDLALPDGQELRQLLSQVDCSGVKWIGDRWFRSYEPN